MRQHFWLSCWCQHTFVSMFANVLLIFTLPNVTYETSQTHCCLLFLFLQTGMAEKKKSIPNAQANGVGKGFPPVIVGWMERISWLQSLLLLVVLFVHYKTRKSFVFLKKYWSEAAKKYCCGVHCFSPSRGPATALINCPPPPPQGILNTGKEWFAF